MALLGEIRSRSWILIVVIGLGMAAFLLSDLTNSPGGGGAANPEIGSINGERITYNDFQARMELMQSQGNSKEKQNTVWQQMVNEALLRQHARKVGIDVTTPEMTDLVTGQNISPLIRRYFGGQQGQSFDLNQVIQYINTVEGPLSAIQDPNMRQQIMEERERWNTLKKDVELSQISNKYLSLVRKGLYTPTPLVEKSYNRMYAQYELNFVQVPFPLVPDSEVQISDEEIQAYINENEAKLDKEANVSLEYVIFNVDASASDSAAVRQELRGLMEEFRSTPRDSQFVVYNDGTWSEKYLLKKSIQGPSWLRDTLFQVEKNTVVGPYLDRGMFKLAKVLDKMVIPDSVESRHILRPTNNRAEAQESYRLLDSLKTAIEAGETTFAAAAQEYGTDATKDGGGDLGYKAQGQFVPEFENAIFFQMEEDELAIVQSQFGYHLIEVTGRKFINNEQGVKVAYISREILPSEATTDSLQTIANDFMVQNRTVEAMRQAALDKNLERAKDEDVDFFDASLEGLGNDNNLPDIIHWAHKEGQVGYVAERLYILSDPAKGFTNRFVVVGVVDKRSEGVPSVAEARSQVEPILRDKKKAEIISAKIKGKGLEAAAAAYGLSVETASSFSYASAFIAGAAHPKVAGAVAALNQGDVSAPIESNNAVFMVQVVKKEEAQQAADAATARRQVANKANAAVNSQLFESLKEMADIEDERRDVLYR